MLVVKEGGHGFMILKEFLAAALSQEKSTPQNNSLSREHDFLNQRTLHIILPFWDTTKP